MPSQKRRMKPKLMVDGKLNWAVVTYLYEQKTGEKIKKKYVQLIHDNAIKKLRLLMIED